MTGKRHSISTDALLEIGDINGLLHEVNGQATGDGSPFINVDNAGGGDEKPDKEEKPKGESVTEKPGPVVSKSAEKSPKEKPAKPKGQPKARKSVDIPSEPKDEWERTLIMMNDYNHAIDRKTDKSVFIEGEAIEVLRSCFGYRTTRLINVIVRDFIEGNKDRLKAMHSRQCRILK